MIRMTFPIGIICLSINLIIADLNSRNNFDHVSTTTEDECLTTTCHVDRLRASLSILSYMNESVSPCDNFYDFVCGHYEKITNKDNDEPFMLTQKSGDQIINRHLYNSIKKIDATTEKFRPKKLVKNFFDLCMDTETIEERGTKSLMEIINKLHGWPLLEGDNWNDSNWRWENVYNAAIKLGVPTDSFLVNVQPFEDSRIDNPLLAVYPPKTQFQKERLDNPFPKDKIMDAYFDYMMNIALKGFKIPPSVAIKQVREVFEFELNLIRLPPTSQWARTQIQTMREVLPNITWDKIFDLSVYGIEINNITEPIFAMHPKYLNIINKIPQPEKVLANYQIWKFIQYAAPYLNSEISKIRQDYFYTLSDNKLPVKSRWETCVQTIRQSLPHVAEAIFIQEYFDEDIRNELMEMIENIKDQLIETLNSISWLDESSREWAIEKINATRYLVAYRDGAYDDEKLDELYKEYDIVDGDYLKTVLRFNYLSQKRTMVRYKTLNLTNTIEGSFSWLDTNSKNTFADNTIRILAGIIQDDQYNKNWPKYMNYGVTGRLIGHEMLHSFGPDGLPFEKNGRYNYENRFNATVKSIYENKTNCLIEHYKGYKYPKINLQVKGNASLVENMPDINGIRLAYYAYQQWVNKHGPEPNLPYVNFTANQLYWISFAHAQCTTFDVQTAIVHSCDAHATNDVRVMGSVSNSPEFASDFNCPIDSRMNPINKCTFS